MKVMTERFSANESIDKFILGDKYKEFKHKFITEDACPYCDLENKLICSPVFPAVLDKHSDTIVRGKNEHEAGHARLTPAGKNPAWSPLKGNLINVLEDLRIEKGICKLSPVFQSDLDYLNNFFIRKIQSKMVMEQDTTKPLNEALIALHFRENGHTPAWNLSEKAQQYFDAVKDIFGNWKNADCDTPAGFPAIEKLADEILAKWNEVKKQQEQQNENGNGQNEQNKDNSDNDKQDKQSNTDNNQDNAENADNGNENNEKQDNAEKQQNENKKENGKENKDGENGQNSNTDKQNGNEQQDNAENADNGEEGQQNKDNAENNEQQGNTSKSNKQNEQESTDKANKSEKGNGGHGEAIVNGDLNEDFSDEDFMEKEIRKEMEKIINDGKNLVGDYKAYTAEDTFIHSKENKESFEKALSIVRGRIARLSGAMEQSLKSMSRNRNLNNRENGNLNMKALHVIAKNLSNNVFYKTIKGISLDTTVTLLIDESGSTSSYTRQFMALAIAISEVLDRLGIKFEVLGHSTKSSGAERIFTNEERQMFHRKNPIVFFEHKRFEDNYRKEKYRLGSMASYCNNVDGEVLIEAFKRANEQKASRHIILVLSDGEPSGCKDYGIGCKNLMKAVDFCRENGTEVYAFGIETEEPRKFYGKDNFIYLENVRNLSETFIRQFSEVITKGRLVK